ncbi:plastocyanin/azurin family copper-binding protein [Spirochaeta dissipatitropha]
MKGMILKSAMLVAILVLLLSSCDTGTQGGELRQFELITRSDTLNIGDGVTFDGFTFNGIMPGPQLMVNEGDTVEITVINEDSVTHGLSIHAANAQTSNFVGNIPPGETRTLTFTADFPGVFMYHCAPGGHGIMTHTMGGQFGMMVVEPKEQYQMQKDLGREPDVKVYLIQHEVYADGRDFFDGKALYVMFNGETFRYVRDPILVRPDDYVRFYYLNVGPNMTSTFHAVGGIWDHIYYGGNPENLMKGTQSVVSGPTDSWVIDWIVPGEGPFTLVTHAFGTQAIKGAVGIMHSSPDHPRISEVRSEGLGTDPIDNPKRFVSPFGLGDEELDIPVRYRDGDRVYIQMVGNSYVPKRAEVPVGTTVTWINEDVFDMLEGEQTGKHDVVVVRADGNERFRSELLDHAETFSMTFNEPGEYEYICSIHPYMRAKITVVD